MSKTFTPIHSSNPELRFVVEKATMEKPKGYYPDEYGGKIAWNKYNEHLTSRPKYPFPALPADCPDELVEGRDFRLEYQTRPASGRPEVDTIWYKIGKSLYDKYPDGQRRIIAIPVSSPNVSNVKEVDEHILTACENYISTNENCSLLDLFNAGIDWYKSIAVPISVRVGEESESYDINISIEGLTKETYYEIMNKLKSINVGYNTTLTATPTKSDEVECQHPFKEVSQKGNNFYCSKCKEWL